MLSICAFFEHDSKTEYALPSVEKIKFFWNAFPGKAEQAKMHFKVPVVRCGCFCGFRAVSVP